jgi:hypothetical protein
VVEKWATRRRKVVTDFRWTEDQERAFNLIKEAICNNVCPAGDSSRQYQLSTDASESGIGGVLF